MIENLGPLSAAYATSSRRATRRIVIDRTYSLEQIVEAHRYVDQGRKRGNVVVTLVADPVH